MTQIEISPNFGRNRNFPKFSKKSKFFEILTKSKFSKLSKQSKFFDNFTKIEIFSKIWLKSRFFDNLSKIGIFRNFRKFWTKSIFFSKIWPKSNFFRKFLLKLKFFEIFEKIKLIRILTKLESISNFDRNQNLLKFWLKSKFFFY